MTIMKPLVACALMIGLGSMAAAAVSAAGKIMLHRAAIVTDADNPSFVQYAVEDLAGYLGELTQNVVPVSTSLARHEGTVIAVGTKTVQQILDRSFPAEKLGKEGYLLKSVAKDGTDYLFVAGTTPQGTKAGLAALMKKIETDGKAAFVSTPLDVLSKPTFAKRGMHLNGWPFNSPYSFRGWTEKEWQRYLDILSYQGVNLFYLWPFMEIMPVPLSAEDQEYLAECRRVVDYAQKKHGMEVWIMHCTNRVAKDRCGVADPRKRPYWRPSQEDLNPGNPEHFKAIMASREALYKAIDNADGFCNIDSDPGYYVGSPLEDYVKVLKGCRELIDRHTLRGRETKLIDWMWIGWGIKHLPGVRTPDHQGRTIGLLKKELPEPWELLAGTYDYFRPCRENGVMGKTILLQYGVIEAEPAYPHTNVDIDSIRQMMDEHFTANTELLGMMGNMQTPVLQFPHMYYFTSSMWDFEYRKTSGRDALREVAGLLYPERRELIADAFLALKEKDPAKVAALSARLDELIARNELGRSGLFGRKLFPDAGIVAKNLALQLRFQSTRQKFVQGITPTADGATCTKLLQDFFAAYLAWDAAHGYHELWGWKRWPFGNDKLDGQLRIAAGEMGKALGSEAAVDRCFGQIVKSLSEKSGESRVRDGCVLPLKKAVLDGLPNLARNARASASVTPNPGKYPPSAANDGNSSTLYWPGALVKDNAEWLQLTWDSPQTFDKVVVRFLRHPSMNGRTIHLQKEVAPDKWEDFATTAVPKESAERQTVATFQLPESVKLDKLRVVNLLDIFEIEVR
jgi:hypothetical protein